MLKKELIGPNKEQFGAFKLMQNQMNKDYLKFSSMVKLTSKMSHLIMKGLSNLFNSLKEYIFSYF